MKLTVRSLPLSTLSVKFPPASERTICLPEFTVALITGCCVAESIILPCSKTGCAFRFKNKKEENKQINKYVVFLRACFITISFVEEMRKTIYAEFRCV